MAMMSTASDVADRGSSPRVLVVVGPGVEDDELRRACHGGPWVLHDAMTEDPFRCVDELSANAAADVDPDLVVCLGSRTLTAEAVALVHDAPLATTRTLAPSRLSSLGAAWTGGSEIRSAVLELRVDGRRRFATEHIDVNGDGLSVVGITSTSPSWSPHRQPLRIGPRGIGSGTVILHDSAGGSADGTLVGISAVRGRLGIRGRHQRFEHLEAAVHPAPFRQIVAGTPSQRRPVVDTAPL